MTIKEMHYDFKKKINKIDSQQYRNLVIPELDWTLNEAYEIFVKQKIQEFKHRQKSIEDIRPLLEISIPIDVIENVVTFPENYWHYIASDIVINKDNCGDKQAQVFIREHEDLSRLSPFDKSSFEWRTVNATFTKEGMNFDTEDFSITSFSLSYIRKLNYMHNAEDFAQGSYDSPNGTVLIGTQDCELPEHTHREIVDIAVLIATGELDATNLYQLKQLKVNMNQNGS